MEKKISFGFSKVTKKSNIFVNKLIPKDDKDKIELIKCLEGQSIQLVEDKIEEAPLVIPLKDSRKTSAALLSLKTRQAVLNGEEVPGEEAKKESPAKLKTDDKRKETDVNDIEKRAAQELLAEVGKEEADDCSESTLVLPVKAEDLPLDGAKEPTIDDYQSIPITQFGLAMLRGMGWKDQPKKKGAPVDEGPMLRPKGMGLGADKALKPKALLVPPEPNEILEIKKGACVRVLGGKHKDLYGQVEGLDDHAGRVIVKMTLGSTKESFNEFMVQPVSKKEYAQYSKCINSAKYDEYKRMENENGQIVMKKEDSHRPESSHHSTSRYDDSDRLQDKKVSSRRNSPESENHPRKTKRRSRSLNRRDDRDDEYSRSSTSHKKYSIRRTPSKNRGKSDESRSSDTSTYRSKHKKKSKSKKSKKSKGKSRERRHSSAASSEDERRHKKKTKKSKRGRSRSRSKGRR